MLSQSKESLLSDSVRKLLQEGKNLVYLSTTFPNGSPQVTPVWVDTDGKFVIVNTAMGRVKYENIQRDSRVALAIADWSNPYNFVQIRGRVVEQITGQPADDHIDKLNMKYHGKPSYPKTPGEHRVILKILPEKVSTWR